jgi:hypothetical protein
MGTVSMNSAIRSFNCSTAILVSGGTHNSVRNIYKDLTGICTPLASANLPLTQLPRTS